MYINKQINPATYFHLTGKNKKHKKIDVVIETYSYFQCPESQQQISLSHRWQWLSRMPSVSQSCYILDTSSLHPCHSVEP